MVRATNLTSVRLVGSAYQSRQPLCQTCGIGHCPTRKTLESEHMLTGFNRCGFYVPTLKFRDFVGTDHRFCTFRSKAWAFNIRVVAIVQLIDAKTGEHKGRAVVESVHFGDRLAMEIQHGPKNHLMIGKKFTLFGFQQLRKRTSGSRIYFQNTELSVIYLRKL